MRTLGPVERRAIRLLSEAVDIPLPIRRRSQAILLAEKGMKVAAIATAVDLTKTDILICLDSFEKHGMYALYDQPDWLD
jgi:hypothetical protein